MDSLLLKNLIVSHKERFLSNKNLIPRKILDNIDKELEYREVLFISGIRRSGKSSLLSLIAKYLLDVKKISKQNILFINFEDERFIKFEIDDFDKLYQLYIELDNPTGKKYLFFDEIQNINGWERWVNRLYEFEDVKIFITGSNASLVSSSISSALTGRNRQLNIYPFSFSEFLLTNQVDYSPYSLHLPEKIAEIKREFDKYIKLGGFPEVVKRNDVMLADQYFKDIIHRDVISLYNIRNIKELKELCLYLITNTGSILSYDSLRKITGARNITTIKNYLNILQDVYLFYSLSKFDYSIKKQIYNPDKYYVSDLGFYNAIGFKFSENLGKILENIVFHHLIRMNKNIFYWKSSSGKEVDFIITDSTNKITEVYQVTYSLTNENRERELNGLKLISKEFGTMNRYILTYDQEDKIVLDDGIIEVLPVWKWLLNF